MVVNRTQPRQLFGERPNRQCNVWGMVHEKSWKEKAIKNTVKKNEVGKQV